MQIAYQPTMLINSGRYLLLLMFFSFSFHQLRSQNIFAIYKVTKEIDIPEHDGYKPKLPPLNFHGYFYKKGATTISFYKPAYFDKYPNGQITYSVPGDGPNHIGVHMLNLDTVLCIDYKNMDSLIWRYTSYSNNTGNQQPYSFNFEPGFQDWELLNETKSINGLNSQRALLRTSAGVEYWNVWFCPDIPLDGNISNIFGLPGLVVEAENSILKEKFSLEAYQINIFIDDKVFWPEVFQKKFIYRGVIRNSKKAR